MGYGDSVSAWYSDEWNSCPCADTLLDNLTVEEMLMYTAEMKNPVRESLASKKAKVALVLEQLALTSCASVRIGNALNRGISGGCHASHAFP